MTFLHCCLMGYSVFRYKRATGKKVGISLLAFIDDGQAMYKDTIENGTGPFLEFVDYVRETYKNLGFILEISKCYLSDRMAIFLNEVYYKGRHITYGLRALMRIGTAIFEPHSTIFDRLGKIAGGCQGAMKSGLSIFQAYFVFLWKACHILLSYRINEHMDFKGAVLDRKSVV